MNDGAIAIPMRTSAYTSASSAGQRAIPVEVPIAIEMNGVASAAIMATPCDLEDFVTGFVLSEGRANASEIGPISFHPVDGGLGVVSRLNLPPGRLEPTLERARRRFGDSSCGICGIESVELALRQEGFLIVTSRRSNELVEKAVRARCPLLVAISAPASLAVHRAKAARLALAVLARDDTMRWDSGPAMETADGL